MNVSEIKGSGEHEVGNLCRGEHNALLTELRLPSITNCLEIVQDCNTCDRTLVNSHADDLGLLNLTFPDTDAISNGAAIQEQADSFPEEFLPHLLSNRTRVGDVATEGEGVGLHVVSFD
jgi:hypothetical protein